MISTLMVPIQMLTTWQCESWGAAFDCTDPFGPMLVQHGGGVMVDHFERKDWLGFSNIRK